MTSLPNATAAPETIDILFVDDDSILRNAYTELLRMQGFAVHAVADGKKALEFLGGNRPRLVITDIFMPDTDGIELILGLKKFWPPAGVLAISGGSYGPPDLTLKTAQLLGKARTLPKPFRPDDLIKVVKEMLSAVVPTGRTFADCAGG
jgi:CheY-like chemotaxis protein